MLQRLWRFGPIFVVARFKMVNYIPLLYSETAGHSIGSYIISSIMIYASLPRDCSVIPYPPDVYSWTNVKNIDTKLKDKRVITSELKVYSRQVSNILNRLCYAVGFDTHSIRPTDRFLGSQSLHSFLTAVVRWMKGATGPLPTGPLMTPASSLTDMAETRTWLINCIKIILLNVINHLYPAINGS